MEKQTRLHHSVTELGNIQVRIITEYLKDGKVIPDTMTYSDPMTVADVKSLDGWDDKTKAIVSAITDPEALAAFEAEKLAWSVVIGIGLQQVISYDREVNPVNCSHEEISIRRIHRIFENGIEKKKWFHRSWIMPGDDPKGADVMSKALAVKLHTPEVIAAYEAYKESLSER